MSSSPSRPWRVTLPTEEHVLDDVEVVARARGPGTRSRCPSAAASLGERMCTGAPFHRISPAVGPVDPGDGLDQHRLAGTVVADERGHLTRRGCRGRRRNACTAPKLLLIVAQLEQRDVRPLRLRGSAGAPVASLVAIAGSAAQGWIPAAVQAAAKEPAHRSDADTNLSLTTVDVHVLGVDATPGSGDADGDVGHLVVGLGVHEARRRLLPRPQVQRQRRPRPGPRGRSACTRSCTGSRRGCSAGPTSVAS